MNSPIPATIDPPPLVALRDATVGYPDSPVLTGVNISVSPLSFAALVGANGSGKTTLLRSIAGILPLLAGSLLRRRADGQPPILGYVPQRERLDPLFLFTGLEVVLMAAAGRVPPGRFYPAAEKAFAEACLQQVHAADLRRHRFAELSGGQKQRVLIARALATRADLLLLDEPTTGLDPTSARSVLELLQELHRSQPITILMVSHDLPAIRRHVHEVFWLDEGQVQHGPTEKLLQREQLEKLFHLQLP